MRSSTWQSQSALWRVRQLTVPLFSFAFADISHNILFVLVSKLNLKNPTSVVGNVRPKLQDTIIYLV